jgi:tRNA(Ile)-lysidine synthase
MASSGSGLQLDNHFESIAKSIERVVLAFSGGVDSCVLLHLLISQSRPFKIQLWHVNHGITDMADEMEAFSRSVASDYKLPIEVSRLNLDPSMANLESEARKARYAVFEQALTAEDCLLTAHHADDQAETLLLNMLRGSGSAGLRGIAYSRPFGDSRLLRPLLDVSRAEITDYASNHRLEWFDDPSNLSQRFNRNYLRHEIIPKIKTRWPGYLDSMRSVISIQAETQQILEQLGAQDYQSVRRISEQENIDLLCCNSMCELTLPRQKNLIRYWLKKYQLASLPQSRLNELIRQLNSTAESLPVVSGSGYKIRTYNHNLYIVKSDLSMPVQETYDFGYSATIKVNEIGLELDRKLIFKRLGQKDSGQSIRLKFRLDNNESNPDIHRLKRLFQKHKIPPWKRSLTPQVYLDNELTGLWF